MVLGKVTRRFISQYDRYDVWRYGTNAANNLIDYLEGDVVTQCTHQMAHLWRGCRVPSEVDNKAFQPSASKGRSKVDRLNDLVRELFYYMLKFGIIYTFYWLSSADNLLADLLSRPDGELELLRAAYDEGFWIADVVPNRLSPTGTLPTRTLPEIRGTLQAAVVEQAAAESAMPDSTTLYSTHSSQVKEVSSVSTRARPNHGHRRST